MGFFERIKELRAGASGRKAPKAAAPSTGGRCAGRDAVRPRPQANQCERRKGSDPFSTGRIFYYFLFAMLFLALYLGYLLMQPFWHTIILACIFAGLCHPLYAFIRRKTGWPGYLASAATLAVLVLLICVPLALFIAQLIPQATNSIKELAQWLGSAHLDTLVNDKIFPWLTWLNEELSWLEIDVMDIRNSLMNFSRTAGQKLVGWGTGLVFDSISIFFNFILMLLIMFFLLKDGEGMVNTLRRLTPLRSEQEDNIIQSLRRMANAVLIGGFSVAAIQGFVGGIGLAIVGIKPLFWGTVMVAAALVPIVGTGLIWAPAVVYLLLNGQTGNAIFLLVWCGGLVTTIDSLLRPIIMRGSSKISLLFLFMSVFGGIQAFGALGIIYGPLILSFVLAMINIYSSEYADIGDHKGVEKSVAARAPRRHTARRAMRVQRRKKEE